MDKDTLVERAKNLIVEIANNKDVELKIIVDVLWEIGDFIDENIVSITRKLDEEEEKDD